jgi:hypothetical protein
MINVETYSKINAFGMLFMVINKTALQILVTDSEQVFEMFNHSYNFVHVINQINI